MTCVSPQSDRKHPRYIILKVSQNISSRMPTCALIRAQGFELQSQKKRKKEKKEKDRKERVEKAESALMDLLFLSPRNTEGQSVCVASARGRIQILKVKSSCWLFFKDPISRYRQRGNSDDMFPLMPRQAA